MLPEAGAAYILRMSQLSCVPPLSDVRAASFMITTLLKGL